MQLAEQPGTRRTPLALHRRRRGPENLRGFFNGQATEVPKLHQLALFRVELAQPGEGVVQGDQVDVAVGSWCDALVERHHATPAAPLGGVALARVVHENAAHHLRRDAEEVRPALPLNPILVDQPKIRLIDQRRWLQRMVGTLAA